MATANYRFTIAVGSGKEGESVIAVCDELCDKLNLRNVKGDPNYSALFRRAVEALAEKLEVKI